MELIADGKLLSCGHGCLYLSHPFLTLLVPLLYAILQLMGNRTQCTLF
jgi:hypothetical protein